MAAALSRSNVSVAIPADAALDEPRASNTAAEGRHSSEVRIVENSP